MSGSPSRRRPTTLATLRRGEEASARHHADRPRGQPHPVRVRRRRGPRAVRPAPDGQRHRPAASRWPRWRCWSRTSCATRSPKATSPCSRRCPGIGKKGAERLIIELRDKVGTAAERRRRPAQHSQTRDHVVEALLGLGFPAKSAEATVDGVLADNPDAVHGRRPAPVARHAGAQVTEDDELSPFAAPAERDIETSPAARRPARVRRPASSARAARTGAAGRHAPRDGRRTTSCSAALPASARPVSR